MASASYISEYRLAWTLLTTVFRHQGQTAGWDAHLKTHTGLEIHPVLWLGRLRGAAGGCSGAVSWRGSRTPRMARRRRGRGSNVQQRQAPQSQRGGPRKVSPALSIQNVDPMFILTLQIIIWELRVPVLNICFWTLFSEDRQWGHRYKCNVSIRLKLYFYVKGFEYYSKLFLCGYLTCPWEWRVKWWLDAMMWLWVMLMCLI